ncbi:DUF4294 domain-containing protein [Phaeodactylibacter luteus]|uniref:DUF4294 domain-containing protein n=1 Tax=Phaeodactylibacter luteus TaxID=1564516 RepID=A0A5C6RGI0_9BACT|nr:DUF4294 domain-containing protein [Phaeodactylibacter luteus]TXB61456.1 DUF4294 domain-containing protein [Phaeodactylibacter luteus]
MKPFFFLLSLTFFAYSNVFAQATGSVEINGQLLPFMVDECGDTLIMATLDDVSVSSPKNFENREDYLKYRRYRRYAAVVYPYAVEAIKLFREVEYATSHMKDREQKRYIRKLHKNLKEDFTDPLKGLTKTQGMILIEMIERELDRPLYDLIKDLRNGLTAAYWNTLGSMFGHDIKSGYVEGADPILDAVLQDMNISYDIPAGRLGGAVGE